MRESSEGRARQNPLSHSADAEGRYWDHGGAPSLGAYHRAPVHTSPHPPAEGSLHELENENGARAVFQWRDGIWHADSEPMQRLAFSPAWLASRGWRYLRPIVTVPDEIVPERKPRAKKDTE